MNPNTTLTNRLTINKQTNEETNLRNNHHTKCITYVELCQPDSLMNLSICWFVFWGHGLNRPKTDTPLPQPKARAICAQFMFRRRYAAALGGPMEFVDVLRVVQILLLVLAQKAPPQQRGSNRARLERLEPRGARGWTRNQAKTLRSGRGAASTSAETY